MLKTVINSKKNIPGKPFLKAATHSLRLDSSCPPLPWAPTALGTPLLYDTSPVTLVIYLHVCVRPTRPELKSKGLLPPPSSLAYRYSSARTIKS